MSPLSFEEDALLREIMKNLLYVFPWLELTVYYSPFSSSVVLYINKPETYHSSQFMDVESHWYQAWRMLETETDFGMITEGSLVLGDLQTLNIELKP